MEQVELRCGGNLGGVMLRYLGHTVVQGIIGWVAMMALFEAAHYGVALVASRRGRST